MQSVSNLFGSGAYLMGALISNYFLIYAGVIIVFLFSIGPLFFIEEPRVLSEPEKDSVTGLKTRVRWGELFKLYFAHAFSWLGIQTMFVYIFAFLEQKMPSMQSLSAAERSANLGQMIGWSFFILNAVGAIWPAFLLEPMSKKAGRVRTQALMVGIMSAGYFGIVFLAHSPPMLYAMMCVLTLGWAAVVSLPFAIMSEKVDKNRMGFFMGIFNLSVVLPQLVASFAMGRIISHAADKSVVFIISGIALAISAFLWLFVSEKRKD
jgi:MFS family permease